MTLQIVNEFGLVCKGFTMSTNLHVKAEREIYSKDGVCLGIQSEHFDLYQTPTNKTYEIMACVDKLEGYKKYLFNSHNLSSAGKYLGTREEQMEKELDSFMGDSLEYDYQAYVFEPAFHLHELEDWIQLMQDNFYEIKWYAW